MKKEKEGKEEVVVEHKTSSKRKVIITLSVGIILIVGLWLIAEAITTYTGYAINENVDEFAECVGENSVLYFSPTCSHCIRQKKMFGTSVSYLNMVDCTLERELCSEKQLAGVPAWEINGEIHYGVQDFDILSDLTGCEVN